jgi:nucleotide-binding universal stress UspA family protein
VISELTGVESLAIPEIKTQIFMDVKLVVECIIDYAATENIHLIVIGTRE